jgi:hypothetical protein
MEEWINKEKHKEKRKSRQKMKRRDKRKWVKSKVVPVPD